MHNTPKINVDFLVEYVFKFVFVVAAHQMDIGLEIIHFFNGGNKEYYLMISISFGHFKFPGKALKIHIHKLQSRLTLLHLLVS